MLYMTFDAGRRPMTYAIATLAALAAAALVFWLANRPQLVQVDAPLPDDFPAEGFSHAPFDTLLATYVDGDGRVDYTQWHAASADRAKLSAYLAAVAAYSPENAPDRFPTRSDQLAYWLNAYNAYVVYSVLQHWPLDSVTDVKAPFEVVTGLGFFWRQRFLFGSRPMSLYAVENDVIRETFRDPRIHFYLNCASESCPVARPELPTGPDLDEFLRQATVDFVSDEANVRIDHGNRKIVLSDIFDWYEKDFANDLRRRGVSSERPLIDYIAGVAPPALAAELRSTDGYDVDFAGYDWALNDIRR